MALLNQADQLIRTHLQDHGFTATVAATQGGLVQIIRPGQTQPDGQFYAAMVGLAAQVAPGDRVHVARSGGGWVVLGKLATS